MLGHVFKSRLAEAFFTMLCDLQRVAEAQHSIRLNYLHWCNLSIYQLLIISFYSKIVIAYCNPAFLRPALFTTIPRYLVMSSSEKTLIKNYE